MHKIRVGVLRGGPSPQYDLSLKTGAAVIEHLPKDIYETHDILIDREGTWHKNGLPIKPHDAISHSDVIFNALHGHYGEDGKVQHILEMHQVPFTGSTSVASAMGINRSFAKELLKREGVKIPTHHVLTEFPEEGITSIFRSYSPPLVVKAATGDKEGVLVRTPQALIETISDFIAHKRAVIVEEYIPGTIVSVGVIDGYRGMDTYTLPAVEIVHMTIDGKEKAAHASLTQDIKKKLEALAQKVHSTLGFRHYSRTDFVVSPTRGIYVLETVPLPELHQDSHLVKSLEGVGAPMSHFLEHVIELALKRK